MMQKSQQNYRCPFGHVIQYTHPGELIDHMEKDMSSIINKIKYHDNTADSKLHAYWEIREILERGLAVV